MNKRTSMIAASMTALMLSAGMAAAQPALDGGDLNRRQLRLQQQQGMQGDEMGRAERRMMREERREDRAGRAGFGDDAGRVLVQSREERRFDRDRRDRDERVIVRERDRGPNIRLNFRAPVVEYRPLPPLYRYVVVGGQRCRVTITRRVNGNGRIVTSERRQCPGRPEVVIRTRR